MRKKLFSLLTVILFILIFPASLVLAQLVVPVTGVTLDHANLILERGDADVLIATVQPVKVTSKTVSNATNANILWTSSDPGVVDVQSTGSSTAAISALTAGTATITVTTVDGGKIATCDVQVVVSMRSLSLDVNETTLAPGDELILNAKIIPADTTNQLVTWQSTNPGIASVVEVDPARTAARNPQGKVTVHSEGETRIIVRSVQNNSITAFCTVTVSSSAPPVTDTDQPLPAVSEPEQVDQNAPVIDDQTTERSAISSTVYVLIGLGAVLLLAVPLVYLINRNRQAAFIPAAGIKGISGHFAGQTFKLVKGKLIFGRDAVEAQIAYPQSNSQISRKHCTLSYDRAGNSFILIDSSTNGTFLSTGERLISGKPYILKSGDKFYMADPKELFEIRPG